MRGSANRLLKYLHTQILGFANNGSLIGCFGSRWWLDFGVQDYTVQIHMVEHQLSG